jgi:cytochrome c peroxidase
VFGPLPTLEDDARFPQKGRPGEPDFDDMSDDDRLAVNRIVANVGKSLDAYMRKVATGRSRFDAYLEGALESLSDDEERGLVHFATIGCMSCHQGPLMSDGAFHNVGIAAAAETEPDLGRADGALRLANALEDENAFTLASIFADPPERGGVHDMPTSDELRAEAADPASLGAIRSPTLRNLKYSAPYGHNGRFETLDAFLVQHLAGGEESGFAGSVDLLLVPVTLADDERAELAAFLLALDGTYPLPPWNNWPDR